MQCAGIDADVQHGTLLFPRFHLLSGRSEYPFADIDADGFVFNQGEECRRRQQAAARVIPANQGLSSDYRASAHIHFGLVVQGKFIVFQRVLDVGQRHCQFGRRRFV